MEPCHLGSSHRSSDLRQERKSYKRWSKPTPLSFREGGQREREEGGRAQGGREREREKQRETGLSSEMNWTRTILCNDGHLWSSALLLTTVEEGRKIWCVFVYLCVCVHVCLCICVCRSFHMCLHLCMNQKDHSNHSQSSLNITLSAALSQVLPILPFVMTSQRCEGGGVKKKVAKWWRLSVCKQGATT